MYHAQDGRAKVNYAMQHVLATDLVAGLFDIFTKLPNGTVPLRMQTIIVVPFNSATTATLTIGRAAGGNIDDPIAADPDQYATAIDLKAAAGTRVQATAIPAPVNDSSGGVQLTGTFAQTGAAATMGELLIILEYAEMGVETHTQG